jgi:hypothetical protein
MGRSLVRALTTLPKPANLFRMLPPWMIPADAKYVEDRPYLELPLPEPREPKTEEKPVPTVIVIEVW